MEREVSQLKILSLFDGMACGMLAMMKAGIEVEKYVAYEIDKYAIQTAKHNFPMVEECGDVFDADFTQYKEFDYLIGGSPCTYWSIAQTKNRETVASGMGWELFSQYVRALHEAQPRYFVYENNKSMSNAIRESISETFGFEPICINSALVSAQNRQRLYWVGKRNDDGSYSKVSIKQPNDKGILLKDVLDSGVYGINEDYTGKSFCLTSRYYKGFGNNPGKCFDKHRDTMAAEPIPDMIVREATQKGYTEISVGDCVDLSMPNSKTRRGRNMADKSNCMQTSNQFYQYVGYAIEFDDNEKPIKAVGKDGKSYTVYEIKDGYITIKDKTYPIKLIDGYYIIRKLTVTECMRLQTIPEWYEFPVSNSQAYKMLGNGWTVDVIAHLLEATNENN